MMNAHAVSDVPRSSIVAATPRGFTGAVSVKTLPEILQLYVLSMATGVLLVDTGECEGALHIDNGAVVHATTSQGAYGETAFLEVMRWAGGEFSFHESSAPTPRSITCSWTELVMESVRLQDEANRSGAHAALPRSGWTVSPPRDEDLDFEFPPPSAVPRVADEAMVAMLERVANDVPGLIAASLLEAESGMTLASRSNVEASAARMISVRQHLQAVHALRQSANVEDTILSLDDSTHFLKPVSPDVFLHLAVDRRASSIGLVRVIVGRHLQAVRR